MEFKAKKILKSIKTTKHKTLRTITAILLIAFLFNIPLYLAFAAVARQWGTDTDGIVITNGTDHKSAQQVIRASDGDFIVSWRDNRSAPNSIYLQKLDSSGTEQWTANGELGSGTVGGGDDHDTIPDESGGNILVWSTSVGGTINIQNINSSGTVQWGADGLTIPTSASGSVPALLPDNSGGAYLTYRDTTAGLGDIYMTYVDSTGAVDADWNPPIAIESTASAEDNPGIIAAGTNDVIIHYEETTGNIDIRIEKVAINSYSTYSPGDTVWSATMTDATYSLFEHKAISDGSDGIIVTYGLNNDIYAQRYDSSGTAQWGTGAVVSNASGAQYTPGIVSDNSGGAVISWWDDRGADTEVYAQRVNSSGVVQWTANGIAVSDASDGEIQYSPQITTNGGDGAIIAFVEFESPSMQHIRTQHLNGSGTAMWTAGGFFAETETGSGVDDLEPFLAGDGNGGAFIVWERAGFSVGTDLNGQFVTDTTAFTGGMCASADTSSELCGTQQISSSTLSFTDIPDTFSFTTTTTGSTQNVCNNTSELPGAPAPADICSDSSSPDPPGADDLLEIYDDRGSGGLEVQVTTDGTFSDGSNTIPLDNLYIITSIDESDIDKDGGVNYETFTGTKSITTYVDVHEIAPGWDDISDPTTYTGFGTSSQFGGSPLVLMDGELSSGSGRDGYMSLYTNFNVTIDYDQIAGDYSLILTYDLLDKTT